LFNNDKTRAPEKTGTNSTLRTQQQWSNYGGGDEGDPAPFNSSAAPPWIMRKMGLKDGLVCAPLFFYSVSNKILKYWL